MLVAPDVRVIGEAATAADALRLVRKRAPDLVMLGCYPATSDECSELLERIKAQSPSTSVILITGSERTFDLARAIRLGCSGYLHPRVTRKELLKALRAIGRGECIVDPGLFKSLLRDVAQQQSTEKVASQDRLTRTEQEMLRLITEGQTNREIAGRLGYSAATVKDYVQRIIQKLGVSDRTQAAVKAVRTGLVT